MESENKTEFKNPVEETVIAGYSPKRSYWEFGIFVTIILVLVAVVGVLGFLVYKSLSDPNKDKASIQELAKEDNQAASTEEAKEEKKAEEVAKPNEEKVEPAKTVNALETAITVLNGGAVGGSAGKVKEALVAKGYKKVETGNSNKGGYTGVTVFYQSDFKAAAEKVVADLKAKYPSSQAKAATTSEEKSAPFVIILGK